MERGENFQPGDRNTGNGNSLEQKEASKGVFEDGQVRDTTGAVRPMRDGESYVYGDSKPDRIEMSDTFDDISDSPMVGTTRENFSEAHRLSEEELRETSHGQNDGVRPQYEPKDGKEGKVIVQKENA